VQREPGALRAGVNPDLLPLFEQMCARERCPFAVVGVATDEPQLVLEDGPGGERVIDMPMEVLLGKPPRMHRDVQRVRAPRPPLDLTGVKLEQVAFDVLRHPTVASKRFLITIGDRTVGGLSHRDPMVGPWQVPVADCAVTLADFAGFRGEAMAWASARRWRRWTRRPRAAWRWARPSPTCWPRRSSCRASSSACNWMAACGEPGEDAALYDTVKAVGLELCPALGIGVPVGKDSLSMRTRWTDGGQAKQVTAPVSLIVTAFATLDDVRGTLDAAAAAGRHHAGAGRPGPGPRAWAARCWRRCWASSATRCPTSTMPALLKALVAAVNELRAQGRSWPTTTAATAACGRRCARWPLPASAA
jgi:phosphoribosylformylglycinamidine synthase